MQELKKILDEIDGYVRLYQTPPFGREVEGTVELLKRCGDIIRKHMNDEKCIECNRRKWYQKGYEDGRKNNDSWVSVNDRLPEDETMMLVTFQTKAGRRSVNRAWYGEGFWHGTGSMSGVIAWRPLPEPYRPERRDKHDGE